MRRKKLSIGFGAEIRGICYHCGLCWQAGLKAGARWPLTDVNRRVMRCGPCSVECATVNVMSIAGSGLRAASMGGQAAAANVARLPVAGAARIGVAQSPVAGGGVTAGLIDLPPDPSAPVSDLVAAKQAVLAFSANALLIRRSDQMLGALLDVRA